jgi:CheY-like chemotaxis protein
MEAIGTLAGGVAHDLNNILSGILSYPELLLMDMAQDHPLRKPIETIQESGKKAAAIVDDLLTMARRAVTVSEVVNLNDIISEYLISPEFEKLKTVHPFFTKKIMGRSGTGLGMAVVWGIVQDHKGYIDVESFEGKGTTINLYFPITRKEIVEDPKKDCPAESYMGNGESILVVDDVEKQREIASIILSQLNYSVNTVACGEAAVEYIKHNEADLLVLDMIMDPGIDGLKTYKEILKLNARQRAVITSGFSEMEKVKEAQRLGAVQYVKKPYTIRNIGVAIKSAFECDLAAV